MIILNTSGMFVCSYVLSLWISPMKRRAPSWLCPCPPPLLSLQKTSYPQGFPTSTWAPSWRWWSELAPPPCFAQPAATQTQKSPGSRTSCPLTQTWVTGESSSSDQVRLKGRALQLFFFSPQVFFPCSCLRKRCFWDHNSSFLSLYLMLFLLSVKLLWDLFNPVGAAVSSQAIYAIAPHAVSKRKECIGGQGGGCIRVYFYQAVTVLFWGFKAVDQAQKVLLLFIDCNDIERARA